MTRQTKTMLNNLLLENYKQEHSIPFNSKLGTYGFWVAQGYRPRKGEPAKHHCKLWTKKGFVNCWLWTEKQVDKI